MYSLPFSQAMDFIEDHIINNNSIQNDIKLSFLNSEPMVAYSFVGAFLHSTSLSQTITECDEEDPS